MSILSLIFFSLLLINFVGISHAWINIDRFLIRRKTSVLYSGIRIEKLRKLNNRVNSDFFKSRRLNTKLMSSPEKERDENIELKTFTKIDTKTLKNYKKEIEKEWRLVLHDDPIHEIDEVIQYITKCVPVCKPARAHDVTMEVHLSGSATVTISNKKIVEEVVFYNQLSFRNIIIS
jgi:ATP-dependent Clp protease adapter protein ClpS